MATWLGAEVGSKILGLRATEEEHSRLDYLRAALGLKSKSDVVRMALDALEILFAAVDVTQAQREDTQKVMSILRVRLGVASPAETRRAADRRKQRKAKLRNLRRAATRALEPPSVVQAAPARSAADCDLSFSPG